VLCEEHLGNLQRTFFFLARIWWLNGMVEIGVSTLSAIAFVHVLIICCSHLYPLKS